MIFLIAFRRFAGHYKKRMNEAKTNKILQFFLPVCFGVTVIILWEVICRAFAVPKYLVPTPSVIVREMGTDSAYLLSHLGSTFIEAALGLLLAASVGFALGCLFVRFNTMEKMTLPYFVASQAIPIVAVAPLFILWFGNGTQSKVAMAALICFFPIIVSTSRGLRSISREQLDLFRMHAASEWHIFSKLRLPAASSQIFTGLRVSSALAMIGAIVAEYSGADRGIGYVIMQSTYRLDTPLLFAAIICSALAGLAMFATVVLIEKIFFKRYSRTY
jgi:NitT/TauT family transport system permease protein